MSPSQLKSLITTGDYRPSPDLVAEAMLARRSVRTILEAAIANGSDGRSQRSSADRNRLA